MFELVCKECGAVMAISPYGGFLVMLSAMPLPPFCCEFAEYEMRERRQERYNIFNKDLVDGI